MIANMDALIIDESTQTSANTLNYVDRLLREATKCSEPFGGKVIVLCRLQTVRLNVTQRHVTAGDWHQLLPVVKTRLGDPDADEKQRYAAVFNSAIWEHFVVHELTQNMRLKAGTSNALIVAIVTVTT